MNYLLGIDIGTSSAKSVLLDETGRVTAIGQQLYDFDTPRPGWAEQEPDVWWAAAKDTIRQILGAQNINPQQIKGISFAGQMHGPAFLDEAGRSVRPAIIWADQRSSREVANIYRTLGTEGLYRHVGNPVDSGFMAATLPWLKTHEPDNFRRVDAVLLPKDYIKFKLTGQRVTDPSDAGGTSLYDVRRLAWSDPMLDQLGLPPGIFPAVSPSTEVIGTVSRAAAQETGLAAGTPVANGGNDQVAGALASGAIAPGTVMLLLGTGGTLFTTVETPVADAMLRMHTYPHGIPGKWHLLGAILSGGFSLKWLRNLLNAGEQPYSFDDMTAEAAKVAPGAEGALFLPYLAGERTPHMDSFARGVFFGLTVRHTRAHVIRAAMEGVVFAMRDCLEIFKDLGVVPDQLIAGGGGAQSELWRQIQADVFNLPVVTVNIKEKSATGAAMLAGVGTGLFPSFEAACERVVNYGETNQPQPGNAARYEETYRLYRSLYPKLKESFAEAAQLV